MKVKVIKDFRDKYMKKVYKIGEELEITKERYEEINSTPFGVFVEEVSEKPKVKRKTRPTQEK